MQSIEHRALGSRVLALIDDDSARALALLGRTPALLNEAERRASRFRSDSELSRLNAAGEAKVSHALFADIEASLEAARWTGGLVTPTVLTALEAAGYVESFEALGEQVSDEGGAGPCPDSARVRLDPSNREVRLPPGLRLDLGGTLKGRLADQLSRELGEHAPALVDAGGDIAVSGPRQDGLPWSVGVGHPDNPNEPLCILALERGGVATSGRDFRRWKTARGWAHHLIDPRSGRPSETDVLTATVIARSAHRADVAAKAVLLLGSQAGLAFVESHPELEALVVRDDTTVRESSGFAEWIWSRP